MIFSNLNDSVICSWYLWWGERWLQEECEGRVEGERHHGITKTGEDQGSLYSEWSFHHVVHICPFAKISATLKGVGDGSGCVFHLSWVCSPWHQEESQAGGKWVEKRFLSPFLWCSTPPPEVLPGDCGSKKEETAQKGQRRITEWFGLETKIILQWEILMGLARVV